MRAKHVYHIIQTRMVDGDFSKQTDDAIIATYHNEQDALEAIKDQRKAWEGKGDSVSGTDRSITCSTHHVFIWERTYEMRGLSK